MFVEAHQPLTVDVDVARERLVAALTQQHLQEHSDGAYADGLDLFLKIGPGKGETVTKLVHARVLEPRQVGRTVVIPLRWEATGSLGRLYPTLDANVGITAVNETVSVISLIGSYTPPLGVVGSALDHAGLSRIAQATIDSLLARLARAIATPVALAAVSP